MMNERAKPDKLRFLLLNRLQLLHVAQAKAVVAAAAEEMVVVVVVVEAA